jgi:hypothetical protein
VSLSIRSAVVAQHSYAQIHMPSTGHRLYHVPTLTVSPVENMGHDIPSMPMLVRPGYLYAYEIIGTIRLRWYAGFVQPSCPGKGEGGS